MNENPRLFGYGSAKSVLVIATAIDRLTSPKPQAWCVFWDFIRGGLKNVWRTLRQLSS